MYKEHKVESPQHRMLRSFYEKQQAQSRSPDNKSLGKERNNKVGGKNFYYHLSLPKPTPFSHKYEPQNTKKSASPKPFHRNILSRKEETQISTEKSGSNNNFNRYQQADFKIPVDKQKKINTSPNIEVEEDQGEPKKEKSEKLVNEEVKQTQKNEGGTLNVKSMLTVEEYDKFGERFPEKFKRMGLLGRGGFSVVWLAIHKSSRKRIAIKHILSKNPHETHLKQIWLCSYFFQKGGQPRQEFKKAIGIQNLCKLYSFQIEKEDTWLYYELCDESLSGSLFDLKGQTMNGQRLYRINYGPLLYRIRADQRQLKKIIIQVSKALMLLNSHNIVHSDLKTQNIMLKTHRNQPQTFSQNYIRSVKLIDFGSSFLFTNLRQFSMATPEYMPPQILNYILYQNNADYDRQMLQKMSQYKNSWTIDIWSLGCILLEIVTGVPLWMSAKTRTPENKIITGLFAVKNRVFNKIVLKQIEVVEKLDQHLQESNHSGIALEEDLKHVLKGMLCLEPMKRISPWEVLTILGVRCQRPIVPSY